MASAGSGDHVQALQSLAALPVCLVCLGWRALVLFAAMACRATNAGRCSSAGETRHWLPLRRAPDES